MGQQVLVRCKQVVIRGDILNESRIVNNINTQKHNINTQKRINLPR